MYMYMYGGTGIFPGEEHTHLHSAVVGGGGEHSSIGLTSQNLPDGVRVGLTSDSSHQGNLDWIGHDDDDDGDGGGDNDGRDGDYVGDGTVTVMIVMMMLVIINI